MHSEKPHGSVAQLAEHHTRPKSDGWTVSRALSLGGFILVVLSALICGPITGLAREDVCGIPLLHMIFATLFLSVLQLNPSGRNAIANHGGIGLVVGLATGYVLTGPKAAFMFALLFAIPGAVIGLVIGVMRRSIAELCAANEDTSAAEGNQQDAEKDGP